MSSARTPVPAGDPDPTPTVLDAALREAGSVVGRVSSALENVWDRLWEGHLADTTRWPRTALTGGRGWTLHRYTAMPDAPVVGNPVLLVPPLGAPDLAFDLRRGNSLVEFLLEHGRTVYMVTYDAAFWRGRRRGLETWVDDVLPAAVEAAHADADGAGDLHLAGWSLGGLFVLLTLAAHDLPVASGTAFAAPVDVDKVPIVAPFRSIAEYTGGAIFTTAYRVLGGFPASAVRAAFQLVSADRFITKPITVLTHLDDRELLEQMEAVDVLMHNMVAYPGRAFGQVFHHVIRGNEIARDAVRIDGRRVRLADVEDPILLIAGADDGIAPVASVRKGVELLTKAADLRFEVEPGGHLGVLTGRRAKTHSWPVFLDFITDHDD
ncbi:alpha/beta fold hydrolase [Actinomycetospora chiangmaiensis]|uniref:alpha/beta fold hydrolase n=1 Tax=Actinomycetospora chiangmaiensis TaxID=402650 RepID=UPI00037B4105|nr:alpha/beta fold hydrolase [Actinomycetospora chiangmaiensis]